MKQETRVVDISRRDLFKITGLTGGGLLASSLGFDLKPAYAASRGLKISNAKEFKTVCPYCAVGCGTIAYVHGSGGLNTVNSVVHVEGDPDSPINAGTLCPKGASQMQLAMNPRLEKGPKYRAANATEWQDVDWDFALDWLARKFKDARDEHTHEHMIKTETDLFLSPDQTVERVRYWKGELPVEEFFHWFEMGGLVPHEKIVESMKLYAKEVMPHVR